MESIRENWEAFAEPMKDEIRNGGCFGCLWKVIKWILILAVVSAILSKCNPTPSKGSENPTTTQTVVQDAESEVADNSQLALIYMQIQYAMKQNIKLHRFPDQEASLAHWLETSDEKTVYLTIDNIFGAEQYKITERYDGYVYCGQLKDGRPDGYGILCAAAETSDWLITYDNHAFSYRYIGQFSDGRFDGFGVLFTESENGCAYLSRLCPYDEATGENTAYFLTWANYPEYFGEFSDGYKSGLGNSFHLSDAYIGTFENALSQIDLDNPDYSITVGKYKKDVLNGKNKQYIKGYLYYDGESKNDLFDGYGVLYYLGTNIPSYKGEFKDDMRHGTGTSYSETGEIIYQGKWKYDDYA